MFKEYIKKKTIIYGIGEFGKRCFDRIHKYYADQIELIGVADSYKHGGSWGLDEVDTKVYKDKKCNIVIAMRNLYVTVSVYANLKTEGYEQIYVYTGRDNPPYAKTDFFEYECRKLTGDEKEWIPYVEMHLVDFCNLNCAGCTHFAPLYEKTIPDVQKRLNDILYLTKLSKKIIRFDLMGGEPLLSPDLEQYIVQAREWMPDTEIELVTNGLLIPKLSQQILNIIKSYNIKIVISEYEPTHRIIESIKKKLEDNAIDYFLRAYDKKAKFVKPLAQSSKTNYPKKCISNGCLNICDGKIARCPTVMYIHKVNVRFGTDYPTDGIYKLEDIHTAQEINQLIKEKIPLCEYCIYSEMDWHKCKVGGARLDDFVVVEESCE